MELVWSFFSELASTETTISSSATSFADNSAVKFVVLFTDTSRSLNIKSA